jgi:hypothetical protein
MINHPEGERIIRTDNREIDSFLRRKAKEPVEIVREDLNVLAQLFGASIAGRAKNRVHLRRLMKLPNQRVFASAAPDNQELHADGR